MSLEAYVWANSLPIAVCTGTPFRVLLRLADHADARGYAAWPHVGTIADALGCSERTVQRALVQLTNAGLIRVGDQRYVHHIDARYRPTVYDLITPMLVAAEAISGVTDVVTPRPVDKSSRGDNQRLPGVTPAVAHRNRPKNLLSQYSATTHVHTFDPTSGYCITADAVTCTVRDTDLGRTA